MPIIDARAIIVWSYSGGNSVNTLGVQFDDAALDYDAAAAVVRDAVEDNLLASISGDYSLSEVKIGDDVIGGIAVSSAIGGFTQASANGSVGFGVTKIVASGRNGRWFLPGVVEDAVDAAGRVRASDIATLNTRLAAFIAQLTTGGITMTVFQKVGPPAAVSAMTTRNYVVLQSRRLARARG